MLHEASRLGKDGIADGAGLAIRTLPIGVGFQLFNSPLQSLAEIISKHTPAAVWLFAPNREDDFGPWSSEIRRRTNGKTQIWIQVGSA